MSSVERFAVEIRPGLMARFVLGEDPNGRPILTSLHLDGDAITADDLRRVPVAKLERASEPVIRRAMDEIASMPRPSRSKHGPEQFARLVAEHFKVWARHDPNPAAAMAAEWNVKPPTVHTWIREARLRGFLPPASRRKTRRDDEEPASPTRR